MRTELILLVEDDPDDGELTLSTLRTTHPGRVVTFHNGAEALDYLHAGNGELPRVVLLDLRLPGLSGFDALRPIRLHPRTELLPVVILTSSRRRSDRLQSYAGGADSFVTKPIDLTDFGLSGRRSPSRPLPDWTE